MHNLPAALSVFFSKKKLNKLPAVRDEEELHNLFFKKLLVKIKLKRLTPVLIKIFYYTIKCSLLRELRKEKKFRLTV